METTEIKSRVKNTVKVMWFVAFLWVVYSSGRKLWEYSKFLWNLLRSKL